MVVVMKELASDEQVQGVIAQLTEHGLRRAPLDRRAAHGARRGRRQRASSTRGCSKCSTACRKCCGSPSPTSSPAAPSSRRTPSSSIDDAPHRRRRGRSSWPARARPRPRSRSRRRRRRCKRAGAKVLRGGAFKPRSSPYSFQGLGEEGLRMLRGAADRHNLKLVSEVMDISQLELIERYAAHPAGRRAQHAELHAAARARAQRGRRCCSSAASRRRSRSGCCRPSTSSPAAT